MEAAATATKKDGAILITGGNSGIGYALCRQLVAEQPGGYGYSGNIYLGARNAERGQKAVDAIQAAHPEAADRIELLLIDVSNDDSVVAAAKELKSKLDGVSSYLYALVNNAGIGFKTGGNGGIDELLQTNFYGPKRVSEAFVGMIQNNSRGRIVNVGSGAASMFLKTQNEEKKKFYTSKETTWEQLVAAVEKDKETASMGGYGLSKAAVTTYTIQQSIQYPKLVCTSISPGFIHTKMTEGFGAKLTADEGTVSIKKCLFDDQVVSGHYYGSDGLRSPMTIGRDPGMPEYEGEDNPEQAKYNK